MRGGLSSGRNDRHTLDGRGTSGADPYRGTAANQGSAQGHAGLRSRGGEAIIDVMTTTHDLPPTGPPPPPTPRLERSTDDRLVAGVCGGLGRYFNVDPVIFRVVIGVSAIFGPGLLLYAAGWLMLPEAGSDRAMIHGLGHGSSGAGRHRELVPIAIAVVLGLIVMDTLFGARGFEGGWLAVLLVIGLVAWSRSNRGSVPTSQPRPPHGAHFAPGQPSPWPVPPVTDAAGAGAPESTAAGAPASGSTAATSPQPTTPLPPPAPSQWWAHTATAPVGTDPPGWQPPPPRERSRLGGITVSVLLLVAGVAALLDVTHVVDVTPQGILATLLVALGGALVVGAWYGRARGLIPVGVLLSLLLAAFTAIDLPVTGGVGERNWRPATLDRLESSYELGIGEAGLDLSALELTEGTRDVKVRLGVGELRIVVPDDVAVEVDSHTGAGNLRVFDEERSGTDVDLDRSAGAGPPLLRIDARIGLGELTVRRESDPPTIDDGER
jgi:phage shock protein PspC (stress-responsive transcriptional regulator)